MIKNKEVDKSYAKIRGERRKNSGKNKEEYENTI